MKIPGVELNTINPKWRMRTRPWLDMKSLKPVYSVDVYHPDFKIWLAVYVAKRGLKRFKSNDDAERFIAKIKADAANGEGERG